MRDRLRRLWVSVKWPVPLWRVRGWAELPIGSERFRFCWLKPPHYVWALLARKGLYEPEVSALLDRELRPGDTFLDIGAHLGAFSMLAARKGAQVVAIEPDPAADKLLRRNLMVNDLWVEVYNTAVADYEGEARLVGAGGDGISALSPAGASPNGGLPVSCRTLDSLGIAPDVVKIDVEGAEGAVLRGGLATLSQARCVIVELHADKTGEQGDDPEAVLAALSELGPVEELERRRAANRNVVVRPGA